MIKVLWLTEAVADVERLHAFLLEMNADAAARAASLILDGSILLSTMPGIGKPMGDHSKRRELFMSFGAEAYVIRYREQADTVIIFRVWHSREDRR